jgi:hypothetical protein
MSLAVNSGLWQFWIEQPPSPPLVCRGRFDTMRKPSGVLNYLLGSRTFFDNLPSDLPRVAFAKARADAAGAS